MHKQLFKVGGNQKGGRVELPSEIKSMISHQIRLGKLKQGQTAYVKFAGDGTSITRKETCTAHTVTLSNEEKALQIGTISLVMGNETYQAGISHNEVIQ